MTLAEVVSQVFAMGWSGSAAAASIRPRATLTGILAEPPP